MHTYAMYDRVEPTVVSTALPETREKQCDCVFAKFDPRRTQWQPPGEPVRLPERMHQGSQNASRPRAG